MVGGLTTSAKESPRLRMNLEIRNRPEDGLYGVDIPKGVWHKLESLESGSVVFEYKEGPFVPHEVDGILDFKK